MRPKSLNLMPGDNIEQRERFHNLARKNPDLSSPAASAVPGRQKTPSVFAPLSRKRAAAVVASDLIIAVRRTAAALRLWVRFGY